MASLPSSSLFLFPSFSSFHNFRDPPFPPKHQTMAKGPGLYTDIGKKARDLLLKDYHDDQKFTLTTYSSTGVCAGCQEPNFKVQ